MTRSRADASDKSQEHHDGATMGTESVTLFVHAGDASSSHGTMIDRPCIDSFLYFIDARFKKHSNWTRYVNGAKDAE